MGEKFVGWLKLLWDAGEKTVEHSAAIDDLQENDRRLLQLIQTLAGENERLRDELRHGRELRERDLRELKLELRLQISEELRRLPPPKS
jgi:hypothetical protein